MQITWSLTRIEKIWRAHILDKAEEFSTREEAMDFINSVMKANNCETVAAIGFNKDQTVIFTKGA